VGRRRLDHGCCGGGLYGVWCAIVVVVVCEPGAKEVFGMLVWWSWSGRQSRPAVAVWLCCLYM
jgi:hypothetical protein